VFDFFVSIALAEEMSGLGWGFVGQEIEDFDLVLECRVLLFFSTVGICWASKGKMCGLEEFLFRRLLVYGGWLVFSFLRKSEDFWGLEDFGEAFFLPDRHSCF